MSQQAKQSRGTANGCFKSKSDRKLQVYNPVFIHNCLEKVYRYVRGLLSPAKWQSGCKLQCAADENASEMYEADRWCHHGRGNS